MRRAKDEQSTHADTHTHITYIHTLRFTKLKRTFLLEHVPSPQRRDRARLDALVVDSCGNAAAAVAPSLITFKVMCQKRALDIYDYCRRFPLYHTRPSLVFPLFASLTHYINSLNLESSAVEICFLYLLFLLHLLLVPIVPTAI